MTTTTLSAKERLGCAIVGSILLFFVFSWFTMMFLGSIHPDLPIVPALSYWTTLSVNALIINVGMFWRWTAKPR